MSPFTVIDLMPIKWFGDRKRYESSKVKVVTVALNPSDLEFRNNNGEPFRTELRFPEYNPNVQGTLETALDNYFRTNPLGWFKQGFEPILEGMGVSYFDKGQNMHALHTDFCTWFATDPTWSKIPDKDSNKRYLFDQGNKEWQDLIDELNPDIIIFSIPQKYIADLNIETKEFERINQTKTGKTRKPRIIKKGLYKGVLCIFGTTVNTPFGDISNEQKTKLGEKILCEYLGNRK